MATQGLENSHIFTASVESDDIETRCAIILAEVEVARVFAGRERNAPDRKEEETTSAFEVRGGLASHLESQRWCFPPRFGVPLNTL